MLANMALLDVEKVIRDFEAMTKDAENVQRETLKLILEENGCAEYLQNLGLNGRTDPESFKACVPLVTHKDLEPYIQRVVDGAFPLILTGKPITTISLSSGTTQGKPKFVPFNDELMETTLQIYRTSFAFRNRGLACWNCNHQCVRNSQFKNAMKAMQSQVCSPDEVIFSPDFHQSLYCHLLCGLLLREEIQLVSSTFAHSIVLAFQTFEQVWEELCGDIREGVLSSRITFPSVRSAMAKLLKPNPELADLIEKKCSGLVNWYGLIPDLFPNVKYIYGIMTGSMEHYLKKLRHYAGDVPLISADYGASEGWVGANINPTLPPESATYAVLPNIGYFEFLLEQENVEEHIQDKVNGSFNAVEPKPVGLTEVNVGEEYEVIVTSFAGLYRYRLGDVVKVMGFHNSTPELKFVCRRNLMLNINIDKNTEKDLQLSVEEAAKLIAEEKLEVVDFSSHVDVMADPVITSRKVNTIGPLELRVLRKGTFQKILEHYLGLGGALSQFKTPRCVGPTNNKVLQILCDNVAKNYFSTVF
ncbi:Jasmonic acid-amido synthetase JAR1 [Hibiscus syriacus]|uniref:Jasmonic acid-amido synthetase JAR1 n=1 Tax=Hibiscus syriacus TaxID=106335 RepID=A0A6A3CHY4_HIBSY|nr:Jasmonic acid-amido synthetase JAR1 [Hibiscus syriacus]